MIVNWIERGEFQLQRRVQASPKENLRLATLLFGFGFYGRTLRAQEFVVHTSAMIGFKLVTCRHFSPSAVGMKLCSESTNDKQPFVVRSTSIRRREKGETYLLRPTSLSLEKRTSGLI
jgi:hypothetical protein